MSPYDDPHVSAGEIAEHLAYIADLAKQAQRELHALRQHLSTPPPQPAPATQSK